MSILGFGRLIGTSNRLLELSAKGKVFVSVVGEAEKGLLLSYSVRVASRSEIKTSTDKFCCAIGSVLDSFCMPRFSVAVLLFGSIWMYIFYLL